MLRDALSRVTKTIAEMRASPRRAFRVPVKIWFEDEPNAYNFRSPNSGIFLLGKSRDLSSTGMSFFLPAIRIKEEYLVGQDGRTLNVELDLAGRKVRAKTIGVRYEATDDSKAEDKFIVGVAITHMRDEDRRTYEHFLVHGNKIMKSRVASIELGLD